MLSAQDTALEGVRLRAAASQADLLAQGGEASVVTALRRDMQDAPESDHFAESWAAVIQDEVSLQGGRFSVAVEDLQGRFDLNRLGGGGLVDGPVFAALLAALELPGEIAPRIAALVAREGPLGDVGAVLEAGVAPGDLDRLRPHVTVLPEPQTVNLNTVGPVLLGAMLGRPEIAARLLQLRARQGFLTAQDLQSTGALMPVNGGWTSQNFTAEVRAEIDGVTRILHSRILRRPRGPGAGVHVVARRMGPPSAALPAPAPALIDRLLRP
nr:type II secretion system protein GspK [Oceaniglobus trochenteri]